MIPARLKLIHFNCGTHPACSQDLCASCISHCWMQLFGFLPLTIQLPDEYRNHDEWMGLVN